MCFDIFYQLPRLAQSTPVVDRRLQQSVDQWRSLNPSGSVHDFLKHCLSDTQSQKNNTTKQARHLFVFLSPVALQKAKKIVKLVSRYQNQTNSVLTFSDDVTQLALLIASDPVRFFEKFKLNIATNNFLNSCYGFANQTMENKLKDELRKQTRSKTLARSDFNIIKNTSEKKYRECLKEAGYIQEIDLIIFLAKCYKEAAEAKQISSPNPTFEDFQKIANRCQKLTEISIEAEKVKFLLEKLVKFLRQYLDGRYPISLDSTVSFEGEKPVTLLEIIQLPDIVEEDKEETEADDQKQLKENQEYITSWLGELSAKERKFLILYYGLDLTTTLMVVDMKMNQSNVSRNLSKIREKFLKKITAKLQEEGKKVTDSESLKIIKDSWENYLKMYYTNVVKNFKNTSREELANSSNSQELILRTKGKIEDFIEDTLVKEGPAEKAIIALVDK